MRALSGGYRRSHLCLIDSGRYGNLTVAKATKKRTVKDMEMVRIDKWLWAARWYKTRSLASQAVTGGHVSVNGIRVKPSREVRVGDQLVLRLNQLEYTVLILALSDKRGPAPAARTLYAETEASMAKREQQQEERKVLRQLAGQPDHRPDKRERRKIRQFLKKE